METITERLKILVNSKTTELKKYKELEELTRITAASWRSWWNRGGTPSGEMVEAVCTIWPECAFWLVTGIDDYTHGHHAASSKVRQMPRTVARDLFLARLKLKKWEELNSHDERQYAQDLVEGKNDAAADARSRAFHSLLAHVHALEEVRRDQEISLYNVETKEFMNSFLPDD